MIDCYEDIIELNHYEPKNHPRADISKRAAQFAPFAALTGYEERIKGVSRFTSKKRELESDARDILDEKLRRVNDKIQTHPEIAITYFIPDSKKGGGTYTTIVGQVKKIDFETKDILLMDNKRIAIADILSMTVDI